MTWLLGGFLALMLTAISVTDARERRIPDVFSLPLIPVGLLAAGSMVNPAASYIVPPDRLIAVLAIGVILWGLARAYQAWRGFPGLGMGDVKLSMAAAAWIAPEHLALWLLAAATSALAWAVLKQRKGREKVPFGCFLAPWIFIFWAFSGLC